MTSSIEEKIQVNVLKFLTQGMTEDEIIWFLNHLKKEQDKMNHKSK